MACSSLVGLLPTLGSCRQCPPPTRVGHPPYPHTFPPRPSLWLCWPRLLLSTLWLRTGQDEALPPPPCIHLCPVPLFSRKWSPETVYTAVLVEEVQGPLVPWAHLLASGHCRLPERPLRPQQSCLTPGLDVPMLWGAPGLHPPCRAKPGQGLPSHRQLPRTHGPSPPLLLTFCGSQVGPAPTLLLASLRTPPWSSPVGARHFLLWSDHCTLCVSPPGHSSFLNVCDPRWVL